MDSVLFINGFIWQSQQQSWPAISWLLISRPEDPKCGNGKVLALGRGDAPAGCRREAAEVIDLAGAIVLPGLQDAHIHIGAMGESAHYVDLSSCCSILEMQQTVREHAKRKPQLPWVIGTGWDQNLWSPPVSPTRFDLDVALPSDRPCMLYRRCWHVIAANTVAMRAAGVDPDKVWPPPSSTGDGLDSGDAENVTAGSSVEIDGVDVDDSHHPTGLFRENSMKLVESAVTAPSFETRCEQYAEALDRCLRSGLTAVQTNDGHATRVYKRLQEDGRLPIRVFLTLLHDEIEQAPTASCKTSAGDEASSVDGVSIEDDGGEESSRKPWSGGEGLLSWHRVKLFADGSLGAETAAMRLPYVGTTNTGLLIHDQETLTKKVSQAKGSGFRLEIHAIGDRALAAVLDAFEGAGITAVDRPVVTHCQVAGPDLISRMEKLGAVAAVQPSFVPSDAPVVMKRLSPVVHSSCYPWRTLMNNGVTCAGGSDAPIENQDPLQGIYDAVFRPNKRSESSASEPNEFGVDPFLPDERLTLEEAVRMYSAGGAFAAGMEDKLGAIEEGFMADLTIVEVEGGAEALLENPSLIVDAKVSQVWVGGTRRWLASDHDSGRSESDQDGTASSKGLLSGSGLPGKNGPKHERGRSDIPWLSTGPGRIGRCRCCS